ncbi:MAG: ABC transporter ATP-binding protein, partial [Planifilum fimeticola]
MFQNPNDQIFKSTVLDEVMFGPLNIGVDPEGAKEKALQALQMVGLAERAAENPQDLSLSEKKRVCIASIVA